jgi:primosomal protein N' (replication factor Y) (superfamily II helicase)
MFAVVVVNIEAPLEGLYHYHLPPDLAWQLQIGHLVEVEFGRSLAQAIVVDFDEQAPVEETKPVISLIDPAPVVRMWQIELARWLSQNYLAPLNGCLRLFLPPGLTRWSDITLDINPRWDGSGRLTETQSQIIGLLRERGDLRGRQLARAMPKGSDWRQAANQLVRREILRRGSVLDPPRVRPKQIRTAELIAGPAQIRSAAANLGRENKQAAVLLALLSSPDPLPEEAVLLEQSGATRAHLEALAERGLIQLLPAETVVVPAGDVEDPALPAPLASLDDPERYRALAAEGRVALVDEPPRVGRAAPAAETLETAFELRGGAKYHAVLRYLAEAGMPVGLSELYEATGTTMYHLRKLAGQDLIRFGAEEVWRDPLADRDFVPAEAPRLTADQLKAWEAIRRAMEPESDGPGPGTPSGIARPFLLHGVTGSGKTEIYMQAVELALSRGQRAIVLVPEIALTPQTVRRFAARFPGQVAVLHSRLSDGERYDTWRRARQGLFDIAIGPRSALFTPLENLGVIVLDEEHDLSYKQEPPVPPPYYHARETATELGRLLGATVIMGSATPDLVTYHRAQAGRFTLLELPKRIMGHRRRISAQAERMRRPSRYRRAGDDPEEALTIDLPPIQLVDLRQELRAGNRTIFSRALRSAMDDTLSRGEQAILFLNRRGTATFVICRSCGHVLNCPRCDMPLTFHRPGHALVCHHCGRREPQPESCPRCGSNRIRYFGLGTEEVERLVQQTWPRARTVRWDRDTTAGRDTHEELLASFINQEADILVGTQMIAKGLDLPLVTLVGVISADVSLGLPDHRTGERAFQVLAQVAGRAGRGLLGGRVIIQTYKPEHYAIQAAAGHDYIGFYLEEIRFRTQHGLPPFRRLARLIVADPVNRRAERQANALAARLRQEIRHRELGATELLGPTPPFFSRIQGRYRWQIIIRSPDPMRLLADFDVPAGWVVDIDPVSTL